jgi:putative DNA primase/helicase
MIRNWREQENTKDSAGSKVSQVIYQIANGRGRGRGSINGMRSTGSWRTVMLSTGEQSAVDFTLGDGGSRARVISLWGLPFGAANEATAPLVRGIDLAVQENYGHAGPRLIQFILQHQDQWQL